MRNTAVVQTDPSLGQLRQWIWPVMVAATIFYASSLSRVAGPALPGFDKVAHFFVYGLLATLLVRIRSIRQMRLLGASAAVCLASIYGLTDEIHQSMVPGRESDLDDWCVDTAGAALAVFLYTRWSAYRESLEFPVLAQEEPRSS